MGEELTGLPAAGPMLTRKDFISDQLVRWCPGCGDFAILATVQKLMPTLGIKRENIVFVSGIGCSSRFPYYMNTFGFHSIHGRALTLATGLRAVRPDLQVWVVTGDGDGLSIGGNHLLHALRRNIDCKILLFNNRIYGLTKGQYSPTSLMGHKTKSTPEGSVDYPLNPLSVAIASECTFVARSVDVMPKHLEMVLERAARHKGSAFVEIYQNCNIFNDEAFEGFVGRDARPNHTVQLEHGKPLIFGKNQDKGIRLNGLKLEIVDVKSDEDKKQLLVHDEKNENPAVAYFLSRMEHPDLPVPLGVLRAVERSTYASLLQSQIDQAKSTGRKMSLQDIITGKETWEVR